MTTPPTQADIEAIRKRISWIENFGDHQAAGPELLESCATILQALTAAQERIAGLEGALKPFAEVLPKDTGTQSDDFPANIGMMNGNVCQRVFSGLMVRHFWDAALALLPSSSPERKEG